MVLQDGNIDGNSAHAKLRLTIPRQPDLKTAHRAQRMRFVLRVPIAVLNHHCHDKHGFP